MKARGKENANLQMPSDASKGPTLAKKEPQCARLARVLGCSGVRTRPVYMASRKAPLPPPGAQGREPTRKTITNTAS